MKFRKIKTSIWRDSWYLSLSRASKLVFIFLFTNEYIGFTGVYEAPDQVISFHTGVTSTELEEVKKELYPKVLFYNGWVSVVNSIKHDPVKGGKKNSVYKAYKKEEDEIPIDIKGKIYPPSMGGVPPVDGGNGKGKGNGIGNSGGESKGGDENAVLMATQEPSTLKQTTYGSLKSLDETAFSEISEKYQVPVSYVRSTYDDLVNYCEGKGKKYSNYYRTLSAWVKRGVIKIASDQSSYKYGVTKI